MMTGLLRVMYAPLDYIHPGHFTKPDCALTASEQQAINHTLIRRYRLKTSLDFPANSTEIARLAAAWGRIPQVAWLLGCKLARGSLAMNGQLAALPASARQFVELPVFCPSLFLNGPMTRAALEMHGARYLFQWQRQLPESLAQRLPLLFAPDAGGPHESPVPNRSLLTFAFDYAKNSQH